MSYGVVIPVTGERFAVAIRLLQSIRDRVTDQAKMQVLMVTNDDYEQDTLRGMINNFAVGSTATVLSFDALLGMQRFPLMAEVRSNIYNRPHFIANQQSLKTMLATDFLKVDQTFVLAPDSYVYREMSMWDDVINVYLQMPRHFSYVSTAPFLNELITGSAGLLGINREVLTAYNYEYQDTLFEKDLFKGFCEHIAGAAGANSYFEAIARSIFSPRGGVFFESMAYRYYLERQKLQGDERLYNYMFLDSFDALLQVMPDAALAAARPKEHPIERLCAWLRPATFDGLQQFVQTFRLCMLRLERNYPQPWLVKHFLQSTPEIKLLVASQDYELYL